MNSDGSKQVKLTNHLGDKNPSWSPDGKKIAFEREAPCYNFEIYVMNAADGSGQTRLTNNANDDYDPSWSPDGKKIAFSSDREGNYGDICNECSDGSSPTRLTNNAATHDWNPSWSPDGKKIAFASVSRWQLMKSM